MPAFGGQRDAGYDGTTDFSDLLTLAQHYGATNATWEQGDFNHDGIVGFADLLILAQNYGATLPQGELATLSPLFRSEVQQAFAQVPEPCSFDLAVMAAALIRRRKSTGRPGERRAVYPRRRLSGDGVRRRR